MEAVGTCEVITNVGSSQYTSTAPTNNTREEFMDLDNKLSYALVHTGHSSLGTVCTSEYIVISVIRDVYCY